MFLLASITRAFLWGRVICLNKCRSAVFNGGDTAGVAVGAELNGIHLVSFLRNSSAGLGGLLLLNLPGAHGDFEIHLEVSFLF